ncbi:ABC1 kinase family protein [Halomarina halobia]|uniref:ABC1 kinase family protein n=1 Tax=Halomarina halobia TaxID=3033386 RepID=A0ABD6A6T7_9EURY|nr:AarF/ABC1/UbiB kinase family protein [Halomarina sp. PSR21]
MTVRAYRRFFVVAWQFLPVLLAYARDRRRFLLFGPSRQVSPATRRRRARALLESMLTLGPTFIKLGQLLSTRPDILPPEYVEEFATLQDEVPPAPWLEARRVIEEELGPPEEVFDDFDTDAISGASLGQVYVARCEGERVAVKVRRPNIEALVEADLRVIKFSLPLLMRFVGEAQSFSLETLADEFAAVIREEMDYDREARMLEEIRSNFTDNPTIRIPAVIEERSTDRVLTMEFLGGTKISEVDDIDALGVDRTGLAENLQRIYLQMIIDDGVFHADPHPGNLAVQDDGTLVFYDFGMSGRVPPYVQDRIVEFYVGIANQDIDAILDALIEMGTLSPEADRDTMGSVMELAIADVRGEQIEQYRVQQIVSQVEDTIYEFPLRLPPNLALVLRVATVVEGVCVTLDPRFDFIEVATSYLRERGYMEAGIQQFVEDRVEEVNEATQSIVRVPPKLERTLDRLERNNVAVRARIEDSNQVVDRLARRLVLGLLLAALTLSTTLAYTQAADEAAAVGGALALLTAFLLYRSFRTPRGIRAQPQFTRQNLRQRGVSGLDGTGEPSAGGSSRTDGSREGSTTVGPAESDEASGWGDAGGARDAGRDGRVADRTGVEE